VAFGVAQFADFELDSGRHELRRGDRLLKLEKIPMDLLTLLVESNGQLLSRDQIIEKIWGKDVFLDTEHGINTAVRKIRQALGDDPEQPRFVQTVTGKGYRFIAPVTVIGEAHRSGDNSRKVSLATELPPEVLPVGSEVPILTAATPPVTNPILSSNAVRTAFLAIAALILLAAALVGFNVRGWRDQLIARPNSQRIRALAVLPLENLSGDPTQDYFADGMTDELITMIAKNADLRVISRTSAMQYKNVHRPLPDIARELGVDGILEGSVGRSGNQVHINAQLIYAPTDTHVWAESYDRSLSDVSSLQTELAQTIARQVGLKAYVWAKPEKRINPDAHDAYLLGRYFWFADDFEKSRTYFLKAIDLQPDYAAAWSGVADSYAGSAVEGNYPPEKVRAQAAEAAKKALELDDSLAEAHNTMAAIDLFYRWDWSAADKESARAIQLNRGFAEGHQLRSWVLRPLNRLDEALQEQKEAMELNPFTMPAGVGYALLRMGQFDAAVNEGRLRAEAQPNNADVHNLLAYAYLDKGMEKEGEQELEQTLRLSGGQKLADEYHRAYARGGMQAVWECSLNDLKQRAAKQYVSPLEFADTYGSLRRKEETLHYLELAYKQGVPLMAFIQSDPTFVFLHAEPRYRDIVNKMGLPPAY
jgi:TolB-like protein/DNA-binding winged helix-turn-helix (wHTH) protein/Tfp pilus assembly protein PilF